MEPQIGYLGATQQTWKGDPIRLAVLKIRSSHPRASRADVNEMLAQAARDDDDLLVALAEYGGNNAQNAIEAQERREHKRMMPHQQEAKQADFRKKVDSIKSQILLLNLEMPNGKRMRYCTGAEMEGFGQAYRQIAKKVGKTKRVGEVLSEAQVKLLMKAS